jgi:exo-beta-1,3-glucanase (GH17 family)
MLNYLTDHGGTDPNTAIGDQGAALLIAKINDTRSALANLKLSKNIPVGNAEAGYYFNTNVLEAIDYGLSNVDAWFANTSIDDAASWVFTYFNETNVAPAALLPNHPKMYIAETGWPSASSDAANAVNGGGTAASVPNLQTFINDFVCQANSQGVGYFFFEFIDEQWKEYLYGGVEGHWGLFDKNYNLKAITLPDCLVS